MFPLLHMEQSNVLIGLMRRSGKLLFIDYAIVGAAISRPRSSSLRLPARLGEESTMLGIVPFSRTLKFVTWRAAGSRPYGGWFDQLQFARMLQSGLEFPDDCFNAGA